MDTCYLVVAEWEPDGRIEVWRDGAFDSASDARDTWTAFEGSVGGGKFLAVLKVDLIADTGEPPFDAMVDFSRT